MNITFLIGNGFDLGLKLKTGYEDFYPEYCKEKDSDSKNIKAFKEMLRKRNSNNNYSYTLDNRIVNWSDFEKAFGEHSLDFYISQKTDYIERFEDFIISFNKYLEGQEKQLNFSAKERIAEIMLNGVTTYFYIRNEDRAFIQNLYNTASASRVYNFISFNYTSCIDKAVEILKNSLQTSPSREVGKMVHIHGFIEENMIMGVNDASQIFNPAFAVDEEIISEIVKPQQNADVKSNYERETKDIIDSSDIICIYGMSIGETDKKWWKYIAEWLAKNSRHALVILKYDVSYNKRFPHTQKRLINSTIDKFLSLSDQSDTVLEEIKPKIFVGMNHNVFEMDIMKMASDAFLEDVAKQLITSKSRK